MDLTGCRFGRWIILGPVEERRGKSPAPKTYLLCRCNCGTERYVWKENLRRGQSKSCGCLKRDLMREKKTTHGLSHTPEYRAWLAMKQRCYDPNSTRYKNWGGRGIRVCDHWLHSFMNFFADMGQLPAPRASLERVDNQGNYTPGNCRWASAKEQARNTRRNRMIEYNGKTHALVEWSEITGLKRTTIAARLDKGWSVHNALTTPVLRRPNANAKRS